MAHLAAAYELQAACDLDHDPRTLKHLLWQIDHGGGC